MFLYKHWLKRQLKKLRKTLKIVRKLQLQTQGVELKEREKIIRGYLECLKFGKPTILVGSNCVGSIVKLGDFQGSVPNEGLKKAYKVLRKFKEESYTICVVMLKSGCYNNDSAHFLVVIPKIQENIGGVLHVWGTGEY